MRYPLTNTGTRQEFELLCYNAQEFGEATLYGRHEGEDWNFRTGGDTDLGKEIKSIANGTIVYYHRSSHPTTGFSRHIVVKIEGPWGVRWVMYAHMMDQDFLGAVQNVTEGQIIGRVGNNDGRIPAHLHFSIFKVDPSSLASKIDSIAHNETELNTYWENPTNFINQWITPVVTPPVTDIRIQLLNEAGILTEGDVRLAIDRYKFWDQMVFEKAVLQTQYDALLLSNLTLKSRIKIAVDLAVAQAIDSTI